MRAELKPSLAALITDPGGVFFAGRVDDWIDTRRGTGFVPQGVPRVHALPPSRAIVYLRSQNAVATRNLDGLRRNWSELTPWINVDSVAVVDTVPDPAVDDQALEDTSPIKWAADAGRQIAGGITLVALAVGAFLLYRIVGRPSQ